MVGALVCGCGELGWDIGRAAYIQCVHDRTWVRVINVYIMDSVLSCLVLS